VHYSAPDDKLCKRQEGPTLEGITPDMATRLKARKRAPCPQSENDRWKDIYEVLFPNEPVPSPCEPPKYHISLQFLPRT
jgi:hypothetical protein